MSAADVENLRGPILRSVSRSFYLSLRMLPGPLRDPLSLGYLLARSTDTIADTSGPAIELRIESLRKLGGAIQGTEPLEVTAEIRSSFAPLQSDEAERALIEALPVTLEGLAQLSERDRGEVRTVLGRITRGQMLDLERFGAGEGVRSLATAADLDEYTYLVAGCVGEFWTRLCFAHVANFSERSESEMEELGVRYGKGLQLINILRDTGRDLAQGRCYLPAEELGPLGLTPEQILSQPEKVEPVLNKWRDAASSGLDAGLEYGCAIEHSRVRCASVLPALIGARTLALLRAAGPNALKERVKVPRSEIQGLMLWVAATAPSPNSLRKKFAQLSTP